MKLRFILTGLIILFGLFTIYAYGSQSELESNAIQQDSVSVYWTDNSQPQLVPLLLVSDSLTVTQYVDIEVRQNTNVITQSTHFVGNGYNAPGVDLAEIVNYQFDLMAGGYDVYCRLRVEVIADNLAYGTNEDDLQITTQRTFYGTYIDNGQIVELDSNNFALCNNYSIGYKYYFPIILK